METTGNDQGGGGGGICTIKTSDLIGMVGNLMERVQNIEQVLSLLTGANITTSTLAEISQSLDTVTNATLINMLGGWTTDGTFSGVAISTLGWVMSDGCPFPIVVMKDGVLQYGLDECGNVSGEQSSGGVGSYLILEPATTALSGSGLNATASLKTIWSRGSAFGTTNLNVSTIDINEDGLYHISIVLPVGVRATAGSTWMAVRVRNPSGGTVKEVQDIYGQHSSPNSQNQTLKASFSFKANAGGDVKIMFNSTTGSLFSIAYGIVSIEKIG